MLIFPFLPRLIPLLIDWTVMRTWLIVKQQKHDTFNFFVWTNYIFIDSASEDSKGQQRQSLCPNDNLFYWSTKILKRILILGYKISYILYTLHNHEGHDDQHHLMILNVKLIFESQKASSSQNSTNSIPFVDQKPYSNSPVHLCTILCRGAL